LKLAAAVFAALVALPAIGAEARVEPGDLAVARVIPTAPFIKKWLTVYAKDGREKFSFPDADAVAIDGKSNLFVLQFDERRLTELDRSLAVDNQKSIEPNTLLSVRQSGDVLLYTSPNFRMYFPNLLPIVSSPLPGVQAMDLAGDECTLVYIAAGVRRWDICNWEELEAGNALVPATVIRAMRGGGYVSSWGAAGDGTLTFVDGQRQIVRVIDVDLPPLAHVQALAFDADPDFLWVGTSEGLFKVQISTENIVESRPEILAGSIAVYGEARPFPQDVALRGRRHSVRHR